MIILAITAAALALLSLPVRGDGVSCSGGVIVWRGVTAWDCGSSPQWRTVRLII